MFTSSLTLRPPPNPFLAILLITLSLVGPHVPAPTLWPALFHPLLLLVAIAVQRAGGRELGGGRGELYPNWLSPLGPDQSGARARPPAWEDS